MTPAELEALLRYVALSPLKLLCASDISRCLALMWQPQKSWLKSLRLSSGAVFAWRVKDGGIRAERFNFGSRGRDA